MGQVPRYGSVEYSFQSNESDITIGEPQTSCLENSWDKSNFEFLNTNSIWNLHMLWKYLHHLVRKESSATGSHTLLCFQTSSVASPGENSCHGDWKTPTRAHASHLAMDIEDTPRKTPGMNPTRMPINFLHSRKPSKEKCHNTLFSKMRNTLKLLKGTF